MTTTILKNTDPKQAKLVALLLSGVVDVYGSTPFNYTAKDFYSDIVCGHLKVDAIHRGHVTCFISVKPPVLNVYGGMHGGAIAAVAERIAIACARTVVAEDKEIFLGELSNSYLSAAPINAELIVDGSVVRSGKNLTVVAIEFKDKNSGNLVYVSRATFYNTPASPLAKL